MEEDKKRPAAMDERDGPRESEAVQRLTKEPNGGKSLASATAGQSNTAAAGGVRSDSNGAISFLVTWSPRGPWALTSIEPDGKGRTTTRTFGPPDVDSGALLAWLEQRQGLENIYFSVNEPRGAISKKAEKTDIARAVALHVDVDPRVGEDPVAERARILKVLRAYKPAPTLIIDSGGGYQAFWKSREPVQIDGEKKRYEDFELYNRQLENELGGDHCHNIDRIMRLVGTVNVPNRKKRSKGRVPVLAKIEEFNPDLAYDLSEFKKASIPAPGATPRPKAKPVVPKNADTALAPRQVDIDKLPKSVPDWVRVLIVKGDEEGKYKSRSDAVWAVLCQLVRAGVDDDTMLSILMDRDFKISDHIFDQGDPAKAAWKNIRSAREHAISPHLQELNERYFVVKNFGGRCLVLNEEFDEDARRHKLTARSFTDFKNAYCNVSVEAGEDDDGEPLFMKKGQWWINHPDRRQFERVDFLPAKERAGVYNLWQGFGVPAVPGDGHRRYLEHLRENVCSGDEVCYQYLVQWMARLIQHPAEQGHAAIVLKGERGVGKSVVAEHLGKLLGRHQMTVSNPDHLFGKFNGHLRDCVLLFADEAFYAGEKKHESILKTLITSEDLVVERKGIDAEHMPNYLHLILASNNEWVVPAGEHERRFLVLNVGSKRRRDIAYFKAMKDELVAGGYSNLLHHLQTLDISKFEPRVVPETAALREQQRQSQKSNLQAFDLALITMLARGETFDSDFWKRGDPAIVTAESILANLDVPKVQRGSSGFSTNAIGLWLKKRDLFVSKDALKLWCPNFGDDTPSTTRRPGWQPLTRTVYKLRPLSELRARHATELVDEVVIETTDWRMVDADAPPTPPPQDRLALTAGRS